MEGDGTRGGRDEIGTIFRVKGFASSMELFTMASATSLSKEPANDRAAEARTVLSFVAPGAHAGITTMADQARDQGGKR